MTARQARLQQLNVELEQVNKKQQELISERKKLEREQFLEEHPCSCVKLNGDVEIYDMAEQSRRNRNPLQLGAVYDTYSARNDCQECGGTGKPKLKHNHFGDMFVKSCQACQKEKEE